MDRQKDLTIAMFLSVMFHTLLFIFPIFFFVNNTSGELQLFKKGLSSLEFTIASPSDYPLSAENENMDNLSLIDDAHRENAISTKENTKNDFDPFERGVESLSAEAVNIYPRYPLGSRIRNEEGDVKLVVTIEKDGSVKDVSVLVSSGYRALDDAARHAFLTARFPLHNDDEPRKLIFVVCFRLQSK